CWGGERWLAGVSEIRRNKPVSGPSRIVPAHPQCVTGAEGRVACGVKVSTQKVEAGNAPPYNRKPKSGG
ncbi:MAG: hypothetical protein Q7T73_07090, partial [Beijerinckiaceae bacterium]|nr:hypothetical protein [Beijerinckiaceae bacterium]